MRIKRLVSLRTRRPWIHLRSQRKPSRAWLGSQRTSSSLPCFWATVWSNQWRFCISGHPRSLTGNAFWCNPRGTWWTKWLLLRFLLIGMSHAAIIYHPRWKIFWGNHKSQSKRRWNSHAVGYNWSLSTVFWIRVACRSGWLFWLTHVLLSAGRLWILSDREVSM